MVSSTDGDFLLTDGSTIAFNNGAGLVLKDLTNARSPNGNWWSRGNITAAAGATTPGFFSVVGATTLWVFGSRAKTLSVNLSVAKNPDTGTGATLNLGADLTLSGASNYIDVFDKSQLQFTQTYDYSTAPPTFTSQGNVRLGAAHTGDLALQVETGGAILQNEVPGTWAGAVAPVATVEGAVYNAGGTVQVGGIGPGAQLKITGEDANGYSYWQDTGANALLAVLSGDNINAVGSFQIDTGTVQLTAPSGSTADELDGTGLDFGNANATKLTIVDNTAGTPGTITVQGPVTLAANTTTRMNYNGTNNTADLLDVKNGVLTLAGTLFLKSSDGQTKLTQARNFFDDSGTGADIAGAFATITGDLTATYAGQVITNNPQLKYYQITMS